MVQSNRTWIFIAVVISIAVVAAGWFLGIQPQLSAAAKAQQETADLDDRNALAQLELARLKAQDAELPKLQSELDDLQLSVPDEAALEKFAAEVASLAAANGVSLTAVSFTQAVPAVPAADYAGAVPADLPIENLATVTYTISVLGPRDGLVGYLKSVQLGERLSVFPSFTLAQGPDATSWGMDVTGVIFVLSDGQVVAADPGASENPTPDETPAPSPSPTPGG
jgi:hypothetical protein